MVQSECWSELMCTGESLVVRKASRTHQASFNSLPHPASPMQDTPCGGWKRQEKKKPSESPWYCMLWSFLSTRVRYIGLNSRSQDNPSTWVTVAVRHGTQKKKITLLFHGYGWGKCKSSKKKKRERKKLQLSLASHSVENPQGHLESEVISSSIILKLDLAERV